MPEDSGFWAEIVPKVDADLCQRCADCAPVAACLAKAFRRSGQEELPEVDGSICFGCFSCVGACRFGAIVMPRQRKQAF